MCVIYVHYLDTMYKVATDHELVVCAAARQPIIHVV
jgi:hypothetical protein